MENYKKWQKKRDVYWIRISRQSRTADAVVLEVLKGQKTLSGISSEFSVHPNQISAWKKQVPEGMAELFGQPKSKIEEFDHEAITAPLYQQIGQLKVELDFIKRKRSPSD